MRRIVIFLSALVVAGAFAVPAGAAPDSSDVALVQRHPGLDWMGSQVVRHDGAASRPVAQSVAQSAAASSTVPGLDVSSWQGNVDWKSVAAKGARFAIVKATEGTSYRSPYFSQQYTGAYDAGLVHGAYHFATPDTSSGASQASYFVKHGGGWSKDGKTFPGMLDIEWNPYGSTCYGKSKSSMASWIRDFTTTYKKLTTRDALIYTANGWWSQCVGSSGNFGSSNPLVAACYCTTSGTMPHGWTYETIWQWSDHGTFPGDQDRFNGNSSRVAALAKG